MTAFLIVRAEVDPSVKDAFDAWYQHEHLPEAVEAFGATSAWRGWSSVNDNVPMAFYEFMEPADVNRVMDPTRSSAWSGSSTDIGKTR